MSVRGFLLVTPALFPESWAQAMPLKAMAAKHVISQLVMAKSICPLPPLCGPGAFGVQNPLVHPPLWASEPHHGETGLGSRVYPKTQAVGTWLTFALI